MVRQALHERLNLTASVSANLQAASFEETLRESETYLEHGQIHLATDTLETLQGKTENPEQAARLAGALGHAHYLLHQPAHRQTALVLLVQAASSERLPNEARSRYANLLANALMDGGEEDSGKAAEWYGHALAWAAGNPALALTIKLNQTRLLRARRLEAFAALFDGIAVLPDSNWSADFFGIRGAAKDKSSSMTDFQSPPMPTSRNKK